MGLMTIKETVLNCVKTKVNRRKISDLKDLNFLHKKDKLTLCEG